MSNYQLPEGYKQTEVGVIPEDWTIKNIGDVADVKTGPFGSVLHESDYVPDGTPIITVEHLGEFGVEYINLPKVSDRDKKRLNSYILKVGDIVFSRVGSVDRNALIRKAEEGWLFSGRLLRIRLNTAKDYPHYLSYHFHSQPFKRRVIEVAVGQTMPSLNTKILKNIKIVLPTEKEQRAIARALSDADTLIAALDKQLAKKRHIKTATMQQLLTGKKRLPGFGEGKGYKKTDVGLIPEDWNVEKLTNLCETIVDCPHSTPVWTSNGFVVLRNQNIRSGKLDLLEPSYTDESHFIERTRRAIPTTGDLVITREAPMGEVCIIPSGLQCCLGQRMVLLRPNLKTTDSQYLLYELQSEPIQQFIRVNGGTGSTVGNLRIPIIEAMPVCLSPLPEQRAIAQVLTDIDTEIAALEKRRAKTQAIKQGMMQELLTGRTRLINN